MAQLPLEGVKVLDFTWILIGPQCGEYLAALGADVIKVESNVWPDAARRGQPAKDRILGLNRAGTFNAINRGKKSILLNLAQPKSRELIRELMQRWPVDILLENFVVGKMKRFGLGYEDIKAVKPDIIYGSMSLLGQDGPDAWHRGWGPTVQSRAGMSWLSGQPDEGTPVAVGGTYPDYIMASFTVFPILMALWQRRRTGEGQYIDFAQNEGVIHTLADAMMDYTMNGRVQSMRGNREPLYAPQGVYRSSGMDNWVAISVASDEEWAALCRAIGRPELATDSRFADHQSRYENHDEIDSIITEWTRQHTNREAQEILQRAGLAAGAVVDSEQFVQDPHLRDRGFFIEVDHDEIGPHPYGSWPFHMSEVKLKAGKAPLFGQHNVEVFSGILGLSEAEIGKLVEEKVIY